MDLTDPTRILAGAAVELPHGVHHGQGRNSDKADAVHTYFVFHQDLLLSIRRVLSGSDD